MRRLLSWARCAYTFFLLTAAVENVLVKGFAGPISRLGRFKRNCVVLSLQNDSTSTTDITLFSPCKINLFLRILRKRPDGYHDLASLFQTVGFGDTLNLKITTNAEEDSMECNMAGVPVDKTNLVLRAIELVKMKTGNSDKIFRANLIKQVPAQAGLGGGSGNAAAAMWGANELLGRPATLQQLVEWSGALGSDITFFLSKGTAYCTGRGEIMTPVSPMADGTKLYILKPAIGLSTPSVFKALQYDKLSSIDPEILLERFLKDGPIHAGKESYINDLELPAFLCAPELKTLKEELLGVDGFKYVMMSGSGSAIFCIGEPKDREAFYDNFGKRDGLSIFPTQFVSRNDGSWFQSPQ